MTAYSQMSTPSRARTRAVVHALVVVLAYALLFTWLYAQPIITQRYLSESDLYEYYLPVFLSPITTWSSFEFSGLPAFADPGDFSLYPPHFLFARIIGSWTGFIISALVMAAVFTYAYVYRMTGSRTAAAFAGLAYAMSEAIVERIAHLGTMHCFAWLPLILLAIEGLRGEHRRQWIGVGGVAVACAFLAGHPQPAIYTVYFTLLYALVGTIAQRADRWYPLAIAEMYVVGGLLASVKAIPLVEASFLMTRQVVNFSQFIGHGNTPWQLLSAIFPSIVHEGREAPTYVGLATLLFALVGASMCRRNWRLAFWLTVGTLAVVITAGDVTPIPQLLYTAVPLYQKFRVGSRHLFLAAFGAAFLAAYAIAALQRGDIGVVRVRIAAGVLLLLAAGGAIVLAVFPASFDYEARHELLRLPVWPTGVWVQFGIAATTIVAASVVRPGRRFSIAIAVVMAILFADDLYSYPYAVTPMGVAPMSIATEAAAPSVHAVALGRAVEPLRQRVLAIGGTQIDALIPAAFARLWNIPIAGGYGPMLLQRYSDLAAMGTNGAVRPPVLGADDRALDVLAVRYILVQAEDVAPRETFDQDGVHWDRSELGLPVGRPDCGRPYPRTASIPLPSDIRVASIAVVTHLSCSEDVPQGAEVVRVRVTQDAAPAQEQSLRAGVDTAETDLTDAALARRARHTAPANRFAAATPDSSLKFLTRMTLASPTRGGHLEFEAPATNGWITIDRVTLVDDAGRAHPLSGAGMWLPDPARWREVTRFSTSRTTDRGVDEDAPDELPYVVMENLRALPRAWVVPEMRALDDREAMEAIHRSQLPDGSRFDPRRTALVSAGDGAVTGPYNPGVTDAAVERISDSHIVVRVTTDGGGFLVLSESMYPGWRARIDGTLTSVRRADLSLQAVAVPPGAHTVEFELVSMSERAGIALSVIGILLCGVLVAPRRQERIALTAAHAV